VLWKRIPMVVPGGKRPSVVSKRMKLFYLTNELAGNENNISSVAREQLQEKKEKLAGFGHQLHDGDPRVRRLYQLAQALVEEGETGFRSHCPGQCCRRDQNSIGRRM
jgi:hypothetical protein